MLSNPTKVGFVCVSFLLCFCQRRSQLAESGLELSSATAPGRIGRRELRTSRVLTTGTHQVVCFDRKSKAAEAFRTPRAHAGEAFVRCGCSGALETGDGGVDLHVHAGSPFGVVGRRL